jgi:hypothetical protein
MKVALCLRGHMRTYQNASEYIKKLREHCELDIFIHTWEDLGFLVLQDIPYDAKNPGTVNLNSGLIDTKHIIDLYQPTNIVIEQYDNKKTEFEYLAQEFVEWYDQIKFDPTVGWPRMHSFMSQFYKENAVLSIKDEYALKTNTKYDVVIVTRPDVYMHIDPVILTDIKNSNSNIWVNKIELSQYHTRGLMWVCNSFFAGTDDNIKKMQQVYPEILDIFNELYSDWKLTGSTTTYGRMFCVHQLVQYHMTRKNLTPIVHGNMQSTIIR